MEILKSVRKRFSVAVSVPADSEGGLAGTLSELRESLDGTDYLLITVLRTDEDPYLESALRLSDVVIIQREEGYGLAHRTALSYALFLAERMNLDPDSIMAVMVDGDFTYELGSLKEMLDTARRGYLVIGERMSRGISGFTKFRYWGNVLLSLLITFLIRKRIRDTQSGLKVFPLSLARSFKTRGMEFSTEVILRALDAGLDVIEIPVYYRPRVGDSKLRILRDPIRIVAFVVRETILKFLAAGFISLAFGSMLYLILQPILGVFLAVLASGTASIWLGYVLNRVFYGSGIELNAEFLAKGLGYHATYIMSSVLASLVALLMERLGVPVGVIFPLSAIALFPLNYLLTMQLIRRQGGSGGRGSILPTLRPQDEQVT